jgi:hypothetical protein
LALFVINEWLWADSSGANGKDAQQNTFEAIRKLATSDHQIVVIEGSPFDQKLWALCKSNDMVVRDLVKIFLLSIRLNLDRCLLLKPDASHALSDELLSAVKPDDRYLVSAQLSVPQSVLVTTDRPLQEAVMNAGLPCLSRDEFFAEYLRN